jgi:hypothetical protein
MAGSTRVLHMHERVVSSHERSAYLAALGARRDEAAARSVHFWVFECTDTAGRFMEFTEGPDATTVTSVLGDAFSAPLWREVQGG